MRICGPRRRTRPGATRTCARTACMRSGARMGEVRVNVKISNATDVVMARRGLIPRNQVRTMTVEAVVDTGAVRSCIPVDLKEKLGLETERHINAQMANGETLSVEMTEPG